MRPQYKNYLIPYSKKLRSNMTILERLLWGKIRKKQILDIQFYRQRPLGKYIVDFYAPKIKLIIEIDGSGHFEDKIIGEDHKRDLYFKSIGIEVLRFDNRQISCEMDAVLEKIYQNIEEKISLDKNENLPPAPSFERGGESQVFCLSSSATSL